MIVITETKLDGIIIDAEIYIEGYSIVQDDRGRKSGGVARYIKHGVCFSTKNIKVIFKDLLLPKTKNISVGLAYRPPKNTNFLQLLAEILNSLNIFVTVYLQIP